jgi:hypothetical protein
MNKIIFLSILLSANISLASSFEEYTEDTSELGSNEGGILMKPILTDETYPQLGHEEAAIAEDPQESLQDQDTQSNGADISSDGSAGIISRTAGMVAYPFVLAFGVVQSVGSNVVSVVKAPFGYLKSSSPAKTDSPVE